MVDSGFRLYFLGIALPLLLAGCSNSQSTTTVSPVCDEGVMSLLISETAFPVQWHTAQTRRPASHHYAVHRCGRGFTVTNGNAHHDVYEYASEADAARAFARQKARFFAVDEFGTDWKEPAFARQIDLSTAHNSYLACQWRGGYERCELLAQYGRFTTVFYTHMSAQNMSGDDFARIGQAIVSSFEAISE